MFLLVEDGLFYKRQRDRLRVGGTGRAEECRRHICSCHSLGGLGAWEPSATPMAAAVFTKCSSFINLKGKLSFTWV